MRIKEKIIKELSSKECKNFMKTIAILFGVMMFQTYFWIEWHDYLDDMAISYDGEFVEDQQMNLLLLIGLLCLQWIPLYIMFRISFFISDVVSRKFGWYSDFIKYMNKGEKKRKGFNKICYGCLDEYNITEDVELFLCPKCKEKK